jgi:hypothetical protein
MQAQRKKGTKIQNVKKITSIDFLIVVNTFAFAFSCKSLEFWSNLLQSGSTTFDSISHNFRKNIFSKDLKLANGKQISDTDPKRKLELVRIFRSDCTED